MATTYTEHLQLPKHAPTDPFDITLINEGFDKTEAGILTAHRGRAAYNLLDNSYFLKPVNQRGTTELSANSYFIDRWFNTQGESKLTSNGVQFLAKPDYGAFISQYIEKLNDGIYTFAGKVNGNIVYRVIQVEGNNITTINNANAGYSVGYMSVQATGDSSYDFYFRVEKGQTATVEWAALYEGEYTLETLPSYVQKGYAAELLACQMYYHIYATQAARPTHGLDCVPPMRLNNPTQGTIVIDGVTYYYNSADL